MVPRLSSISFPAILQGNQKKAFTTAVCVCAQLELFQLLLDGSQAVVHLLPGNSSRKPKKGFHHRGCSLMCCGQANPSLFTLFFAFFFLWQEITSYCQSGSLQGNAMEALTQLCSLAHW